MNVLKLIIITMVIISFSCKKEDDITIYKKQHNNDSLTAIADSFRIKRTVYIVGVYSYITDYEYSDEKLIRLKNTFVDMGDTSAGALIEFEYTGEKVVRTQYNFKKTEFVFENELKVQQTEFNYSDGNWIENERYTFQYYDKKVSSRIDYFIKNGVEVENVKYIYKYIGNTKIGQITYLKDESDNWTESAKYAYFYSRDKLDSINCYKQNQEHIWINSGNQEYTYFGDTITEVKNYELNWSGYFWLPDKNIYYYNKDGYLIKSEHIIVSSTGMDSKMTYEYEKGVGNEDFFK